MKNYTIDLSVKIILLFVLISSSCISERNYGSVKTETRRVRDFTGIEVSHGIDVYISMGDHTSLEVETGEGLMEDLITEVRGDILKIYFDENFVWVKTANVYINAESLSRISASGGSDVKGEDKLRGRDLELSASGGSDIRLKVDVKNLEVEVSGGADVEVAGTANYLEASASGGADLRAYELMTQIARLEASGGSDIKVHVEKEIQARASGGADIKYRGNPKIRNVKDSSGGDINSVN
jgi:hypothetical protein